MQIYIQHVIFAVHSLITRMGIKYKVNEDFFKKWTSEMAYVLGYLYADGSLEDASYLRGKYVRVSSVEKENIVRIKNWLESEHKIVETAPLIKNRKNKYLLRIGSHVLYDDLIKIGLRPNKSLTIKFPKISKKSLNHFVRGYFDGDGCVMIQKSRGKKGQLLVKKLNIVFTSGSKQFLEKLAQELKKKLLTNQGRVYNGHRSYMLSYSTGDSVRIFKFLYNNVDSGIFVKRKFDVFANYFRLKPGRTDSKIKKILN